MTDTDRDTSDLRRRVAALEDRLHLEVGLRAAQGAELAALGVVQRGMVRTNQELRETQLEHGVVLTDHSRRLDGIDGRLDGIDAGVDSLDAKVDNLDVRIEDLDRKVDVVGEDVEEVKVGVERILELVSPRGG